MKQILLPVAHKMGKRSSRCSSKLLSYFLSDDLATFWNWLWLYSVHSFHTLPLAQLSPYLIRDQNRKITYSRHKSSWRHKWQRMQAHSTLILLEPHMWALRSDTVREGSYFGLGRGRGRGKTYRRGGLWKWIDTVLHKIENSGFGISYVLFIGLWSNIL